MTKDYGDKRALAVPSLHFQREVFVRTPRRGGLTRVLTDMGATVLAEPGGGLSVTGIDAWRIAWVAAAHYIPVQELTPRSASLNEPYLQLTNAGIENRIQCGCRTGP